MSATVTMERSSTLGDAGSPLGRSALRWAAPGAAILVVAIMLLGGFPSSGPLSPSTAAPGIPSAQAPGRGAHLTPAAGSQALVLSPTGGTVHTTVTATATGFPAGAKVNLSWGLASPGGLQISPLACTAGNGVLVGNTITATSLGGFVCTFLVPGSSHGYYWVTASDNAAVPNVANAKFGVTDFPAIVTSKPLFNTTTTLPLPAVGLRSCGVTPTATGACSVTGTTLTPYINASNDPVLNHTSTGVLAMAYTSYTNGTAPCASARPYGLSNIAFETSTNDGATWSATSYLGNPVCSSMKYPGAWEPALTSLANGTLVMAYVEYNSTVPFFPPFYNLSAPALSRLVVTESYNGGTTWTTPTVVNVSNPDPSLTVSFPPVRPSITAIGKTIYLTWMSLGRAAAPSVRSHVAMVVSTTGGKSWSPTLTLGSGNVNSANPNVLVTPVGRLFVGYVTNVLFSSTSGALRGNVVVDTSTRNGTGMTTTTVSSFVTANQTYTGFFHPAPVLAWTRYGVLDVAFVGGQYAIGGTATGLYFYHTVNNGTSWIASSTVSKLLFDPSKVWAARPNSSRILTLAMAPTGAPTHGNVFLEATVFNASACVAGHCGVDMEMAFNTSTNGTSWSGPVILSGALVTNGTFGSWRAFLTGEYGSAIYYLVSGAAHLLFAWANTSCPSRLAYPNSLAAQCGTFGGAAGPQTLWGTTTIALSQPYTGSTAAQLFVPTGLPWDARWALNIMGTQIVSNGSTNITVSNVPLSMLIVLNVSGQGQYNASFQFRWSSSSVASPAMFSAAGTVTETFSPWVPLRILVNPPALLGQNCQMSYGCSPSYFSPPSYYGDTGTCIGPGQWYGYCYTGCVGSIYDYDNYPYNNQYFSDFGIEYQSVGCADSYVSHNVTGAPGVPLPSGSTLYVQASTPFNLNITHWNPLNALCGQGTAPPLPTVAPSTYNYFYDECYSSYIAQLTVYSWFGSGPGNTTSTNQSITVSPTGPVTETVNFGITGACIGDAYYFASAPKGGTWSGRAYNYTKCGAVSGGGPRIGVPLQLTETGLPSGTSWGVTVQLLSGNETHVSTTNASTLTLQNLALGGTYGIAVNTIPTSNPATFWVGTTNATVTLPAFKPLLVTFTQRTLAGLPFKTSVVEQGLPTGQGWSFYVANTSTNVSDTIVPGWSQPSPVVLTLAGGSAYTMNGSAAYGTNGTAYYVQSINLSFASMNYSARNITPGTSFNVVGIGVLTLYYAPMYWLTVLHDVGGTVSATSHWVPSGGSVRMTATVTDQTNYTWGGWTGIGNGSYSGALTTITVKVSTGAITEVANFRPRPAPTWTLTVQAAGILASVVYALALGASTYSGNGTFHVSNVSTGSYALSALTAYAQPSANTRWVATGLSTPAGPVTGPVTISTNLTVTVTFKTQYLLALESTVGGTVTGASAGPWYDAGATVSLTAVPTAGPPGVGYYFVSWNGTVAATTASISVVMSGPATEIAEFALRPIPPPRLYILTVTESGLPPGTTWNATLGGTGGTSSNTSVQIGRLNGTYSVSVPIIYGTVGTRYVPTPGTLTAVITSANQTLTVAFATQYLVTVIVSGGGSASPSSQWVQSGGQLSLSATANTSWKFVNWNGSQYSANPTIALTVTTPMTETATFVPNYPHKTTTDQLAGAPIAFGLLVVLLAAGLAVGYLLVRRRGGGGGRGPEPTGAEEEPMPEPSAPEEPTES